MLSNPAEDERYARNVAIPGFGVRAQEALGKGSVALVGVGGLGSPVALYLAAAGVGRLGLFDGDRVTRSNLQRQILFREGHQGFSKTSTAAAELRELNSGIDVAECPGFLSSRNALDLLAEYDVIVDASDNFPARYLISDAGVLLRKPVVWGAVLRFEGQVASFVPQGDDYVTYRDLFPSPPPPDEAPDCASGGVLGAVCGVIGSTMAMEALKLLAGVGNVRPGVLTSYDAANGRWRSFSIDRDPLRAPITQLADYEAFCSSSAAEDARGGPREISASELRILLDEATEGSDDAAFIDVRPAVEHSIASLRGFVSLPAEALADHLRATPRNTRIVLLCHRGVRSLRAGKELSDRGFTEVLSVSGGIDAWSREVDSTVPRYG